ncbi:hypothetical protein HDU98_007906 [Podochytrium sp. JEL0797]|nr:hypothetical protein HDU98_007906 [Podochytrium sp. JEL0797]
MALSSAMSLCSNQLFLSKTPTVVNALCVLLPHQDAQVLRVGGYKLRSDCLTFAYVAVVFYTPRSQNNATSLLAALTILSSVLLNARMFYENRQIVDSLVELVEFQGDGRVVVEALMCLGRILMRETESVHHETCPFTLHALDSGLLSLVFKRCDRSDKQQHHRNTQNYAAEAAAIGILLNGSRKGLVIKKVMNDLQNNSQGSMRWLQTFLVEHTNPSGPPMSPICKSLQALQDDYLVLSVVFQTYSFLIMVSLYLFFFIVDMTGFPRAISSNKVQPRSPPATRATYKHALPLVAFNALVVNTTLSYFNSLNPNPRITVSVQDFPTALTFLRDLAASYIIREFFLLDLY